RELLESVDVLSIQERRMKIMADLQELAQEARRRYEGASDEFAAGLLNSSVAAWKAMITELARMEKADTSKVESLNAKRVQELVRLVRLTVDASVYELSDRFDLDSDDLFEVFNRNMAIAAEQLEAEGTSEGSLRARWGRCRIVASSTCIRRTSSLGRRMFSASGRTRRWRVFSKLRCLERSPAR